MSHAHDMIDTMNFPLAMIRDAWLSANAEAGVAVSVMDEEEFRAFYERTARPLWAYLSRITGNPHDADDVLQEAYYRFYRAAAKYESEAHRRNSLFQIATNLVRDAARRAKEHVPLEETPARQHDATLRTDLTRAMEQLPPVQREMLWLAYAQGASHEEIAGILGLRTVSIRTLLLRARRKLAALLTQKEVSR